MQLAIVAEKQVCRKYTFEIRFVLDGLFRFYNPVHFILVNLYATFVTFVLNFGRAVPFGLVATN